jgi:hypothetical protein
VKRVIVLLVVVVGMINACGQGCLPEGIAFTTQEQIDNFQTDYPGCTEILGNVVIIGYELTNLNGLNAITSFGGELNLVQSLLINLEGLDNLISIGGSLVLDHNVVLSTVSGLEGLTSIGGCLCIGSSQGNPMLNSLAALQNLSNVGYGVYIYDNSSLADLTGLSGLTTIGGSMGIMSNETLNSLSGLDNLTQIELSLYIFNNPVLTSLTGLENLSSTHGLEIGGNSNLTSLNSLANLLSIGGGNLIIGAGQFSGGNPSLTSLEGLDNINAASIGILKIIGNDTLSDCAKQSICNFLGFPIVDIYDNEFGCNSKEEVQEDCSNAIQEIITKNDFRILPNPSKNFITAYMPILKGNNLIEMFNTSGEKVFERQLTDTETQLDISALPRGVYFVRLQNETMVEVGKMVKE